MHYDCDYDYDNDKRYKVSPLVYCTFVVSINSIYLGYITLVCPDELELPSWIMQELWQEFSFYHFNPQKDFFLAHWIILHYYSKLKKISWFLDNIYKVRPLWYVSDTLLNRVFFFSKGKVEKPDRDRPDLANIDDMAHTT